VRRHPFLILGPPPTFLQLAPIWARMYGPIVFLTSLGDRAAVINLLSPALERLRTLVSLVWSRESSRFCASFSKLVAGPVVESAGSHSAGIARPLNLSTRASSTVC